MATENNKKLPFFGAIEFSPMTEISNNLSITKISKMTGNRKRRLSLSDEEKCESINYSEHLGDFTDTTTSRKCFQDITNTSKYVNDCSPPKRMNLLKPATTTSNTLLLDSDPCGEISFYGGATPETRSPESSPEISKKFSSSTSTNTGGSSRSLFKSDGCTTASRSSSLFRGFSDFEQSKDDEFMLLEIDDTLLDAEKLPNNFNQLVSGNILHKSPPGATDNLHKTPKVRNRLFSTVNTTPLTTHREPLKLPLKRTKSLFENEQTPSDETKHHNQGSLIKRSKTELLHAGGVPPLLRRSISTNCSPNTQIMSAVHRSTIEPDLIGDFSKPFVLPLVTSGQRHQDLKSITASTLAQLIQGDFNETVQSYKIIDCRYPYEYEGGHIQGAINYYTKEHIETELFKRNIQNIKSENNPNCKRDIVIFHCEFSAQRGPKLFRFLRALDRNYNNDAYPALYYPEIYLLEGGYKRFFEQFSELCEPIAYKRMDDPAHEQECRLFRAQKRNNSSLESNVTTTVQQSTSTGGHSRKTFITKRSALEF